MMRQSIRFQLAAIIVAIAAAGAGCATQDASDAKIPKGLKPAQGKWRVAASSKNDGAFARLAGTEVTVAGRLLTTSAPAAETRQVLLTPANTGESFDHITLQPLKGQQGSSLTGISSVSGDIWMLNIAKPDAGLTPTDFLPRDDGGEVVILRRE